MVGRKLENEFPKRNVRIGEPRLSVRGLSRGNDVKDVSFEVRRGEVLALTGLVGAGRTETLRLIFGTLVGALIIAVIQNGMNLCGVESNNQKIVLGGVILGAVLLDQIRR